jgi:hypothetical protein
LLPRLVEHLFSTPIITVPIAQRLLGVAYHSAELSIEKLEGAGILRLAGRSAAGRFYVADEILRVISA